ncbi:glycosyltransferase WbuB [Oleiphilus sp. HI0009]
MKLLFLSFYFTPDLCAGSFRSTALVEELKKIEGLEVTVITTLPNRYASFAAEAPAQEQQGNITIHRIALPPHKSGMLDQAKAFTHFYRQAQHIIKGHNFDVVYGTSSRLFTAFLTARIARSREIPYYLDIRDIFVDTLEDLIPKKIIFFAKPVLNTIENYSFSKAKTINLVSGGFRDYFEQRYPNVRYQFFTNGIDEEFISARKSLTSQANPRKQEHRPITILYAGNIGEGQGLHLIIPQLAEALGSNYHFKIIGDGGRKQALEKSIADIENVELTQPVQRKELIEEYQKADILFLHLNDCKAFEKVLPSKIFEYAATGKPILAGVAGYAAEFIDNEVSNAEVFSPTNSKEARIAVRSLELCNSRRTMFIDKFKRSSISKRLAEDILRILKSS